jgi:DNA end-binding protein Ku
MHSMWKGAVSFGLVMIPVKLYAATEQKDIAFRQVHREDGGRIRFRRFCSVCDEEVPYEDIAKGYELPGGEMVILTEDDMAGLPLPTTKSIEVVQFTAAEQLDPILFNRSYFVEPEAAGARAYCLLRDALEDSGKIAIAQVALRQRESLAILRSRDGVLVLETLLWPDEVRVPAFKFLEDDIEARPQELRMAASLIDSMTVDFDPDEYHDGYREALQELVNAKVEGRQVVQPETGEIASGETSTLADALRASLAAARGGGQLSAVAATASPAAGRSAASSAASAKTGTARTSSAKAGAAKSGTAKTGAAKSGTAKTGTAKTGAAKSGAAKSGAAKSAARGAGAGAGANAAKGSAAKEAAAKDSAAKDAAPKPAGAGRTTAARRSAPAKEPDAAPRRPRRAS